MAKISLMFLLSLMREQAHHHGGHWAYDGPDGPASWPKQYDKCGGTRQSPINIQTDHVKFDETLNDFDLSDFEDLSYTRGPLILNITNNGHSASALIHNEIYCTGGGLGGKYRTVEFHFHWGAVNGRGSEHGIDGRNYPLEMHIVQYATKYGNLANAKVQPDGLAVLGTMFEISKTDNEAFEPIVRALKNIKNEGNHDVINNLHLRQLLPKDTSSYYRYEGSLTTPPCFESVIWTVFAIPQKISERQLSALRELFLEAAGDAGLKGGAIVGNTGAGSQNNIKYMVDNFRPFQSIHNRTVWKSFRSLHPPVPTPQAAIKPLIELNYPNVNQGNAFNFGPLVSGSNTIMSGANIRPDIQGVVDAKAAATRTRFSLSEQAISPIKLGSANEALLSNKTELGAIASELATILAITTPVPSNQEVDPQPKPVEQNVTEVSPKMVPDWIPVRSEPVPLSSANATKIQNLAQPAINHPVLVPHQSWPAGVESPSGTQQIQQAQATQPVINQPATQPFVPTKPSVLPREQPAVQPQLQPTVNTLQPDPPIAPVPAIQPQQPIISQQTTTTQERKQHIVPPQQQTVAQQVPAVQSQPLPQPVAQPLPVAQSQQQPVGQPQHVYHSQPNHAYQQPTNAHVYPPQHPHVYTPQQPAYGQPQPSFHAQRNAYQPMLPVASSPYHHVSQPGDTVRYAPQSHPQQVYQPQPHVQHQAYRHPTQTRPVYSPHGYQQQQHAYQPVYRQPIQPAANPQPMYRQPVNGYQAQLYQQQPQPQQLTQQQQLQQPHQQQQQEAPPPRLYKPPAPFFPQQEPSEIAPRSPPSTSGISEKPPAKGEVPFVFLSPSRTPVRVSNQFVQGMYRGSSSAFPSLDAALRTVGLGPFSEIR